jgi:hypothetical protein
MDLEYICDLPIGHQANELRKLVDSNDEETMNSLHQFLARHNGLSKEVVKYLESSFPIRTIPGAGYPVYSDFDGYILYTNDGVSITDEEMNILGSYKIDHDKMIVEDGQLVKICTIIGYSWNKS